MTSQLTRVFQVFTHIISIKLQQQQNRKVESNQNELIFTLQAVSNCWRQQVSAIRWYAWNSCFSALFFFSFYFYYLFSESHCFTSSISEQVTPFPVSPSGQGPHWNPSAVSTHLTPLKQELTSHLGLLRLGSWVGKFTVPRPLMQKEQQFQRLKETSIMAFSWQALWRDPPRRCAAGASCFCTALLPAALRLKRLHAGNGPAACCVPRQGKLRLFCQVHVLLLATHGIPPARLAPAQVCCWPGEEALKASDLRWPKALKWDGTTHFSG